MSSIPRFPVSSNYSDVSDTLASEDIRSDSVEVNGSVRDESKNEKLRKLPSEETNHLGFANIPNQMQRKAVKKGFSFTIMVVGQSGLGKSTLVNSLLMQDLYGDRVIPTVKERMRSTTKIEKRQIELDERGVKLRLTVVDTPGFGDTLDCTDCLKPIQDYVDGTFEQFFKDECGLNRKNILDQRVHCCLYFISPFGHGLRPIDVECIRRLQHKVNIIPIIAKADFLTPRELATFKQRVMADVDRFKLDIYRLPECDSEEEEDIKHLDEDIKSDLPFAVVGSNIMVNSTGNKKVRGREYPWGVVEIEDGRHCSFTKLRIFLLNSTTHMQDLKDMTVEVHYENYRAKYIKDRMTKRQTDRREPNASSDAPDNSLEQNNVLKQKEEELHRMVNKMEDQVKH